MAEDATHEEADHDDHHHGADRPAYDPRNVELPEKAPPLRLTAPQSDFTVGQVLTGAGIALVGLVVTFGIALAVV
jgi:hypothetical protein